MARSSSAFLLFLIANTFALSVSQAQSSTSDLRKQVADLIQDMNAIRSSMGTLRIEVEALNRENSRLKAQVAALSSANSGQQSVLRQVDARIASLKAELLRADAKTKQEVVSSVTKQIDSLASQMKETLESIAEAGTPQITEPQGDPLTDDYPKNGIMYLVEPGDTISEIATKHGSRIDWIRNANRIVNPSKDLRAGKTIFVPQTD